MKVVLDSNVVISGLFFGGVPGRILEAWHVGRFLLAVSPSILSEYRRVGTILSVRYPGVDVEPFIALLATHAEVVLAPELLEPAVSPDPDDDKFLACAMAVGARVVVSGDADLLQVSGWRGIEVIRPRTFVQRYIPDADDR